MEGSSTIVFYFREANSVAVSPTDKLLVPFCTMCPFSSLSVTIFEQMDCEDGPVVKLVSVHREHRERIM